MKKQTVTAFTIAFGPFVVVFDYRHKRMAFIR